MVTFKWAKQITEIGLSSMEEDERKEKVRALVTTVDGKTILNSKPVSELVDLCASKAGGFLEEHSDKISISDADLIREQLGKIHGTDVVTHANPYMLAEWIMDLELSV